MRRARCPAPPSAAGSPSGPTVTKMSTSSGAISAIARLSTSTAPNDNRTQGELDPGPGTRGSEPCPHTCAGLVVGHRSHGNRRNCGPVSLPQSRRRRIDQHRRQQATALRRRVQFRCSHTSRGQPTVAGRSEPETKLARAIAYAAAGIPTRSPRRRPVRAERCKHDLHKPMPPDTPPCCCTEGFERAAPPAAIMSPCPHCPSRPMSC